MESTGIGKALSVPELAVATADGGNDGNTTREIAISDTTAVINHPVHGGDEVQQMDVVEEEEGGGGSSSQGRSYLRLTQEQADALDEAFQENQNPEMKTKKELAGRINVSLQNVTVWFQTRMARFNQMKCGEDHNEEVISLINKVSSQNKTIISLNGQVSSLTEKLISQTGKESLLTEKVISLTGQLSSLAEKGISLSEKVTSLTEEKHRLETELANLEAAAPSVAPPPLPLPAPAPLAADEAAFLLPVPGLAQAFVGLCPECASNFRNMRGGGGASAAASTSSVPPPPSSSPRLCPGCRSAFRNLAAAVGSLALRQAEAGAGAGAGAPTTTST